MKKVQTLINNFEALYQGEITEKILRIFEKKTGILKNRFIVEKLPDNLKINISKYLNDEIILEYVQKKFNQFKLLNTNYNIDSIDWYLGYEKETKDWFECKIKKYDDVKNIWEINRLQFITQYLYTSDDKVFVKFDKTRNLIKSWKESNPFEKGINWYSNLEIAIRSISFVFIYIFFYFNKQELNESEFNRFQKNIEELLYQHGNHILKDIKYTEKCIPNNHLIGEASALFVLTKILDFNNNEISKRKAEKILTENLFHFRDDGSYIEASLSYHRFTLQMYLIVYLFNKNNEKLDREIENILKNSYTFLSIIRKPDNSYPQYGDWDDGVFYNLTNKNITDFDSFVLTLGYLAGEKEINEEAQILSKIFTKFKIIETKDNTIKNEYYLFEKGKYGILKDKNNYLFINNQEQVYHSHSDGLSIEIMMNGKNILTDSGTYSYNKNYELRKYFRSTKSHNTVYMGKDQAIQIGSFRWIKPPKTELNKIEITDEIYGFKGKIKTYYYAEHERTILYNKKDNSFYIIDIIENINNEIIINWHFDPEMNLIKITDNHYKNEDSKINIYFQSESDYTVEKTESKYSESYNKIENRNKIEIKFNTSDHIIIFMTVISNKEENVKINEILKLLSK